jgi:O-antigen/teichoic acid export membrane protein
VALGRFLGIGSTILATILVPRLLAPREFGELTSLLSVISFAAIVAQVGLGHSSVRFLSESLALRNYPRLRRTLALATGVLAVSSLVASSIAALVLWRFESFFHRHDFLWIVPLATGLILLMAWQQFTAESLRGLHELRWASLLSGGTFGGPLPVLLFLALLTCVAVQGRPTITATLLCQMLGSGVSLAASLVCLRWTLGHISPRHDAASHPETMDSLRLTDLLRVCLPMAIFQLFVIVLQTADIWMAAHYAPLQEVALYGAARRYLVLLCVPAQLAAGTVVASIPNLYARGMTGELQALLRRSATLTALATLVISPLCLLAGGWLMGSLSGSYYQEAATALAILSGGQIVVSLTGCGGMALAMTGRQTAAMWVCLGSALFLGIAGTLAGRWWGIAGIAAASAAATAIQATAEWLVCRRLVGIWTHANLTPQGLRDALGGLLRWMGMMLGFTAL